MQEQTRANILGEYEKIIEDFLTEGELSQNNVSIENACKIGYRKIILAKKFAKIDNDILNLSLQSQSCSSAFFMDLLYLEAKRLRFKEEAVKCAEISSKKTKIKTT